MDEPKTVVRLWPGPGAVSSEGNRRIDEIMVTGGVMLVGEQMTDEDIAQVKAILPFDAVVRRDPSCGDRGVTFFSHQQAIKFGLLPPDLPE